jgi:HD-like signal output (HDOD) protein
MAFAFDRGALRRYVERSLQDLPPLPEVVTKILELSELPTTTASDLERLISSDQAIVSKILRVVNSAYYGLSAQVSNTAHAIVILGFHQVRNLVLGMVTISLVKSRVPGLLKLQHSFWRHSFGSAAAAFHIGQKKGISQIERETAHVAALIHDIGQLFLLSNFTDAYRRTIHTALTESKTLTDAEQEVLGIDHAEVGEYLCSAWKFPQELCHVVSRHHGPFSDLPDPIIATVHSANFYTNLAGFPAVPTVHEPLSPAVSEWLGFSESEEEALKETIRSKVAAAEEIFEIL